MRSYEENCGAVLGSMTMALKAQKALAVAAIPSNIIKIERSSSLRGCSYGIEFSCNQRNNVEKVLAMARIGVKKWNTGD